MNSVFSLILAVILDFKPLLSYIHGKKHYIWVLHPKISHNTCRTYLSMTKMPKAHFPRWRPAPSWITEKKGCLTQKRPLTFDISCNWGWLVPSFIILLFGAAHFHISRVLLRISWINHYENHYGRHFEFSDILKLCL